MGLLRPPVHVVDGPPVEGPKVKPLDARFDYHSGRLTVKRAAVLYIEKIEGDRVTVLWRVGDEPWDRLEAEVKDKLISDLDLIVGR